MIKRDLTTLTLHMKLADVPQTMINYRMRVVQLALDRGDIPAAMHLISVGYQTIKKVQRH